MTMTSYEQAGSRALEAFLVATSSREEQPRAIRAITFHMLEGHASAVFERWKLGPKLEEAVRALDDLPREFPPGLDPDDGIARVDAIYLRHERNLPYLLPEPAAFLRYLQHLDQTGGSLYSWLLSELMAICGLTVPLVFPERPFKPHSRLLDLYWSPTSVCSTRATSTLRCAVPWPGSGPRSCWGRCPGCLKSGAWISRERWPSVSRRRGRQGATNTGGCSTRCSARSSPMAAWWT